MVLTLDKTVADLVIENPSAAKVLERYGIDYCCGGRQKAAEAFERSGLTLDLFEQELVREAAPPDSRTDWMTAPLADLVAYIEQRHHSYLRRELPRLSALMAKVLDAHRDRHRASLVPLSEVLDGLSAELMSHLMKEEMVLFPAVRIQSAGEHSFGSLECPMTVMESEHDDAGDALRRMRELTRGYQVPEDGCASYRELMRSLAELEQDLHMHIHLENNVLFRRIRGA